ncbi:hypothetical protein [Nonomuraea endophytica]|uniref:DUF4267 domain-containing protein n=1 Tax=Nonomuraea endophytica TaxID=714136 RepID=A0A7W8AHT9_9ACTN|nr:hypothetical protein [Nonomuraea endophytica]MBB5085128.1 hypothetical protein [Nonomuraea endophytica]
MTLLPRILGAITVLYSAAIIVRPRLLAGPCDLVDKAGEPLPGVSTLIAAVGARDLAIGAAMVAAPEGVALRTAIAARVASDLSDAAVFGSTLPTRGARTRIGVFALVWATACALSMPAWRRTAYGRPMSRHD